MNICGMSTIFTIAKIFCGSEFQRDCFKGYKGAKYAFTTPFKRDFLS